MPFPYPIGDLTKQQLKALKDKAKKKLYLPIKKLKDLKKKVIKIKGVKLAPEFLELLHILLEAFKNAATAASAATAATAVTDVALSSGNPFPGTGSTIPLVSG